jgi:hypothetical protein
MKAPKLLALMSFALAAPVCAQETPAHFYVGASAGKACWRPGCATSAGCNNNPVSLRAFAGYQINSTFAVEGAFTNFGIVNDASSKLKGHAWEAVGLAFWPPDTAISLYGKFGAFYSRIEGTGALGGNKETSNGPTLGFGFQADFTRRIAFRGEVQHYWYIGGGTLPKSNINAVTGGLLWRF